MAEEWITITLNVTRGVDVSWHWDANGHVVVDESNLSPEDTADLLGHAAPDWIGEAISQVAREERKR